MNKPTPFEVFLESCDGVAKKYISGYAGSQSIALYKKGDIVVTDEVYIKVNVSATAGTIGRVTGFDATCWPDGRIYRGTYIFEVEGRKKPSRIASHHASILQDHDGSTVWVRNVKKGPPKDAIKPHINKFKQTLSKGSCIIANVSKDLVFGEVVRYTKYNVWIDMSIMKFKRGPITDIMIDSSRDTYVFENKDIILKELMMLKLKGALE
jgi:hypothetical protein